MTRPPLGSLRLGTLWLAGCALLCANAVSAVPLKAELHALAAQPRADAPEWIDVRLTSTSVQLLEGALELTAFDDSSPSFVYRTQELALTTGPRSFRLLLPTPASPNRILDREVSARFLVKDGGVWDLGKFPLHSRLRMDRGLVLAVGRKGLHTGEAGARLWQSLRLERFTPEKSGVVMGAFNTSPVIFEPDDFPADPLVYCAFDAALFEPGAFGSLKEKPREALGQWLSAGGSVCVFATEPLDPVHVETLRAWLRADPNAAVPEFDAEGHAQANGDGFVLAHVELGRLVVVTRPFDNPDTPEWRRATAFLWKLRNTQADSIERDGQWDKADRRTQTDWQENGSFSNRIVQELTEKLLPKSVRVIPLPVILAILIGFIVAVGPLDYFLLGKLRARKFTWVLFPLVSVGFTVLTMKLAEHYLGTNTHRGTFTMTDLGSDGRVLRETRCELVLPAKPQEFTRDTQHAFASPLGIPGSANDMGERQLGTVFEGQYPAHYALRFPLAQWTPQMIRVSSLGVGADDSGVNWAAFNPASAEQTDAMAAASRCTFVVARSPSSHSGATDELSAKFLARLSFTPESNSVFALSSPSGASTFDDLALIDSADTHHIVVIAIRREGAEIHAWRRVYPLP